MHDLSHWNTLSVEGFQSSFGKLLSQECFVCQTWDEGMQVVDES